MAVKSAEAALPQASNTSNDTTKLCSQPLFTSTMFATRKPIWSGAVQLSVANPAKLGIVWLPMLQVWFAVSLSPTAKLTPPFAVAFCEAK